MNKIRLLLEYGCYPVWLYDERNFIIDTVLPNELEDDADIAQLCDNIQDTYESLFTNNKIEFCYNGFSDRAEELAFMDKLERLVNLVTERLGDRYIIVNDIDGQWRK